MKKNKSFKCGIITFHRAHNYGAVLQAYALKKTIEGLDVNVSFVDYQNEVLTSGYRLFPDIKNLNIKNYIKAWVHLILDFKRKYKRYYAFEDFINNNFDLIDINNNQVFLDSIVLGSDQIWNAAYTNGIDNFYYGSHENLKAKNIISYAASMGTSALSKDQVNDFVNNIIRINKIGVREEKLASYIQSLVETDVEINLDPTLLLDKKEWNLISSNYFLNEKYILIYEVHPHPLSGTIANYLSKKLGLNIINLSSRTNYKVPKTSIAEASPNDFISLFKNATYVVTTSFHGTVFSTIFEKPFVTLKFNNDIDLRSSSLLNKLELSSRHVSSLDELISADNHINYFDVNEKLKVLRVKSLRFLKNSLLV